MKRLLLRLIISILTFAFSYAVTWVTAYFADEPKPDQIQAVRHIRSIGLAQLQYSAIKGKGKYADLETLGTEGLIDKELASGKKDGYIFVSKPIQQSPYVNLYDTFAKPMTSASKASLFYSSEGCVLYRITDIESFQVSDQDRIPKNAVPIQ